MSVLNVRSFGAAGDGAANDTLAFEAAIAALVTSGGGTLYVPVGTYMVGDIDVGGDNISVIGESWSSVLKRKSPGSGVIVDAVGRSNLAFCNLAFDIAATANGATAINLRGTSNCLVERCSFYNSGIQQGEGFSWTMHSVLGNGCNGLRVLNNVSDGLQIKAAGAGGGGGPSVLIMGNTLTNCQNMGISYVLTADSDVLGSCIIANNFLTDLDGDSGIFVGLDAGLGAAVGTMHPVQVVNNILRGAWENTNCVGIVARPCAVTKSLTIANNHIECTNTRQTGSHGIGIKACSSGQTVDSLHITGNTVVNMDQGAIRLECPISSGDISANWADDCRGVVQAIPNYGHQNLRVDRNTAYKCRAYGVKFQGIGGTVRATAIRNQSIDCIGSAYDHILMDSTGGLVAVEVSGGQQLVGTNFPKYGIREVTGRQGNYDGWYHHNDFRQAVTAGILLSADPASSSLSENNR